MKVGLFFGSFNPIHIGHLIIANVMYEGTDCREIWFVVSPPNPFKSAGSLASEFDRLDMVREATYDDYHFRVSDIEFKMPRPSYTIDTMVYLSEKHPDKQFVLIIGEDNLKSFTRWKNHEQILEHYGLLVYPRPDAPSSNLLEHPNVQKVEAPMLDISATFIRKCVKNERSIKYLVPDRVIQLIESRHLYQ